jgi:hypothetical protein
MRTIAALLALSSAAWAQDQQVGARTKAMGGSYTAFEDDPVSVWLNPAGIATQVDGASLAYQTYTIYEPEIRSVGGQNRVPSEPAWNSPALIPSYLGVTFQLGDPDQPHALGFCFATPFRLKFAYDDTQNPFSDPVDQTLDQVFYRIRAAYAYDLRIRPAGSEGFLTHLALGIGLDVNVTTWEMTEFLAVGGTFTGGGTDMGFGGGAGFLLGLYDNTRNFKVNLGGAYQSKASYDFSIKAQSVPLFDWPNQYQVGMTFYLLDGQRLRLTADAQRIEWDRATRDSELAGLDDFQDATNLSLGFELRLEVGKVRIYPRAGVRQYDAPWDDDDRARLPAIGTSQLAITTRDEKFLILTLGVGIAWSGEGGKQRQFDLGVDVGGDSPGVAAGFTMEF